jgi:hypothetical protein
MPRKARMRCGKDKMNYNRFKFQGRAFNDAHLNKRPLNSIFDVVDFAKDLADDYGCPASAWLEGKCILIAYPETGVVGERLKWKYPGGVYHREYTGRSA